MGGGTELLVDAKAVLGEGALWDSAGQRLLWVDILRCEVHIFTPATGMDRTISLGQYIGAVVPRASGGVVLAMRHGFTHLDLDSEKTHFLCAPEAEPLSNRFNDGKCDPAGRFCAGTVALDGASGMCSLYRLDTDLTVHRMLNGVSNSNGIAWSLDHATMYYIDTPTRQVRAFDYDIATGGIANGRPVITVPAEMGWPDGMTIDREGMLWIAMWGGGCVSRWNPGNGRLLQTIPVPVSNVSSCAFGGAALDELYITSARFLLEPDQLATQPLAGGLFRARPGVSGVPAYAFRG